METVLITGASTGIGYEFAKIFAKHNYNLILVARNLERLQKVKNELQTNSINIHIIAKDLSISSSVDEINQELMDKNLNVNILINNAGFGFAGPFYELDLKSQLDMIQVNVNSLVKLTGLILPSMIKNGYGKIMNVASTAAFQPGPYMAIYYATKAFVLSFSEALYAELSHKGISVTALCPGPTRTEFQTRAGIEHINLFRTKFLPYMSAEKVAQIGYKGLMKGKRVVIPGLFNKLGTIAVRFVPKTFVLYVIKNLNTGD
mgnify:CR=1 FL=1